MPKRAIVTHHRASECDTKYRHETEAGATASFRGLRPYPGGRWHAYRCVWCHGWHVSSGVLR